MPWEPCNGPTPAQRLGLSSYESRVRAADREKKLLEEAGICGCGHPIDDCRPEICSHRFAQDAIWGN